jgi:hypothetical protein
MSENNNLPMARFEIPPTIIQLAEEAGARSGNYAKILKDGRFSLTGFEKTLSELRGRISDFDFYQAKFENGKFTKRDCTLPEGDNFSSRCDLHLRITDDFSLTLSLSRTSAMAVTSYLLALKARGLNPGDVVTRITARVVSGQFGPFAVAVFESGDPGHSRHDAYTKNVTPAQISIPAAPQAFNIPAEWL